MTGAPHHHPPPADPGATEALLDRASGRLALQGARLTDLRRDVLRLILGSRQPVGAYALLDLMRTARGRPAAPPTVYRALDFLLEHKLIHRIERLNAFIACAPACADGHAHAHQAQFLICGTCGAVEELEDAAVTDALAEAAARAGFRQARSMVELEGVCAACAGSAAAP